MDYAGQAQGNDTRVERTDMYGASRDEEQTLISNLSWAHQKRSDIYSRSVYIYIG